jgi:putative membrane protein (TIGR04086 family)
MKNIKYIGYSLLINIILLVLLILITTILSYFNIINNTKIILFIIPIITTLFSNIYLGSKVISKGYIEGLKHGILFILILFLFNILLYRYINIRNIIYYGIFILSSIFGSMIGINIKRKS